MMWETVIGLETHVELSTRTKLLCGCVAAFGGEENSRCCPVCLGLPGALPVLNERAVEYAVRAALALGCTVTKVSRFDRKNYCYPDLPKGYQISQLYAPIGRGGVVNLPSGRTVRIHEMHLEEDAGKLLRDGGAGVTRVDMNRCGIPLLEIVTEPDFRTGEEAADYINWLRSMLCYLEVSDGRLQEGSLRCDVNLSVRRCGSEALGVRTEMKNLGSLRAVRLAAEYESARQIALLEAGGTVTQETRRWDEALGVSLPLRVKEDARDYRYFPEPDLPPLTLSEGYIADIRQGLPELGHQRCVRYQADFGLSVYDASLLTGEKALAEFFEETVTLGAPPKAAANWVMGQVLRRLSEDGISAKEMSFTPAKLEAIISMVAGGEISRATGVRVFDAVFDRGDPAAYVAAHNLGQIADAALVVEAVERVLARSPGPVADWRSGKEKAFGFLLGGAMRLLKGQADPAQVRAALTSALNGEKRSEEA